MFKTTRSFTYLATVALILGCGTSSDMPEIGTVSGLLTVNGDPIEGATIIFTPTGEGRSSTATSGPDGAYSLQYTAGVDGAKVGEHEVVVSTFVEPSGDEGEEKVPGRKEEIPEQYTQSPSAMKVTVASGDNTINLALDSK